MSGDQQVGGVVFGDVNSQPLHAMLWTGTAASAVDLHPAAGFTRTTAVDTNGRQQVGDGEGNVTGGMEHAALRLFVLITPRTPDQQGGLP